MSRLLIFKLLSLCFSSDSFYKHNLKQFSWYLKRKMKEVYGTSLRPTDRRHPFLAPLEYKTFTDVLKEVLNFGREESKIQELPKTNPVRFSISDYFGYVTNNQYSTFISNPIKWLKGDKEYVDRMNKVLGFIDLIIENIDNKDGLNEVENKIKRGQRDSYEQVMKKVLFAFNDYLKLKLDALFRVAKIMKELPEYTGVGSENDPNIITIKPGSVSDGKRQAMIEFKKFDRENSLKDDIVFLGPSGNNKSIRLIKMNFSRYPGLEERIEKSLEISFDGLEEMGIADLVQECFKKVENLGLNFVGDEEDGNSGKKKGMITGKNVEGFGNLVTATLESL